MFSLTTPGPGVFSLTATARTLKVATVRVTAKRSGPVALTLRPSTKVKAVLRRRPKLRIAAAITFTPTGGTPGTQHRTVTLRLG